MLTRECRDIIERCARASPHDAREGCAHALAELAQLEDWESIARGLVEEAVLAEVYKARHASNVTIKKSAKAYSGPQRARPDLSPSFREAHESVYDLRVAGTILGDVWGKDLEWMFKSSDALAKGHAANAKLFDALKGLVGPYQRVRDAVPEARLKEIVASAIGGT